MKLNVLGENVIEFLISSTTESIQNVETMISEYFKIMGKSFGGSVKIILTELIGNAIEWGNKMEATKQIKIRTYLHDENLTVMIQDEGTGFNQELMKRFADLDPIRLQMEREKLGKREGGFGIKICEKLTRDLIYNHSGNIVIFKVPVENSKDTPALIEAVKQAAKRHEKEKILIVEDDEVVADSFKMFLQEDGYEVIVAKNGFTAGLFLNAFRPDLVTLDLRMPLMDGMKMLDYLRETQAVTNIVVISAYLDEAISQKLREYNIPFLSKPIPYEEFRKMVKRMLVAARRQQAQA